MYLLFALYILDLFVVKVFTYTQLQGREGALCVDDVQAKQNGSHSEELDRDLASARIRVCKLEHRCRNLKRSADEAAILQSQLEQTSQECTEWQQRFTCDQYLPPQFIMRS